MRVFLRLALLCGFVGCLFSCNNNQDSSTDLIKIDFEKAYHEAFRDVFLSEYVKKVEYVKLETTPNCLLGSISVPVISENFILIYQHQPLRLLLFQEKENI